MAAPDRSSRNAFRKGARTSKIHEDPTYLTFMFLFHYNDKSELAHSPLFNGEALGYLQNVVRSDVGQTYAENLDNFIRVFKKVNMELPWFWNGLKGIEKALQYGDMSEPWFGAEKPQLEIECLEENVELTAFGLMDLYKRACFDLERWVEVVPRNLREFSVDVYISEVRTFQKDTGARNLGIVDNPDSQLRPQEASQNVIELHEGFATNEVGSGDGARPHIALRFSHCEFDLDSIADYFADLTKNPEAKKPTIKINWGKVTQIGQQLGPNLFNENKSAPKKTVQQLPNPANPAQGNLNQVPEKRGVTKADPLSNVHDASDPRAESITDRGKVTLGDAVKDALGSIKDDAQDAAQGAIAGATNAVNSLSLQPNGIGNVHGTQLSGAAGTILDLAKENLTAKLLLDNVHDSGGLGSIQDAINGGLINAISNQITGGLPGGANNQGGPAGGGGINDNIHPTAIDSTPDGNISPKQVYDPIAPDRDEPINDNVHD